MGRIKQSNGDGVLRIEGKMLHPYPGGVYGGLGASGWGVGELLAEIGEKKGFLVSLWSSVHASKVK